MTDLAKWEIEFRRDASCVACPTLWFWVARHIDTGAELRSEGGFPIRDGAERDVIERLKRGGEPDRVMADWLADRLDEASR